MAEEKDAECMNHNKILSFIEGNRFVAKDVQSEAKCMGIYL